MKFAHAVLDGTHGYVDETGGFTAAPGEKSWGGKGPLRLVYDSKKYGFINREGDWVVEPTHDLANKLFTSGLCRVKNDGKFGFIDETGELVIDCVYVKAALARDEGILVSTDGKKFGYIDRTGKALTKEKYKPESHSFANGCAMVMVGKRWGFINAKGKEILKPSYSTDLRIHDFSDNGIVCMHEGKVNSGTKAYLFRRDGSKVTEMELESADDFSDGVALARRVEGGACFIDTDGEVAFELQHNIEHRVFSEQRLGVHPFGEFTHGFIDPKGALVIEPAHRYVQPFVNGFACVGNDAWEWTYIDHAGKAIADYQYGIHDPAGRKQFRNFSEGVVVVYDGKAFGMLDANGTEIVACEHRTIGDMTRGFAFAEKDDKWGWLRPNGTVAIPFDYEAAGFFAEWE